MMFTTNTNVTTVLKNELGELVPVGWTEEYLSDDILGTDGPKLKVGMIAKPANGKYRIETTKDPNTTGELKVYLYDNLAQVVPQSFGLNEITNVYEINYSQDPGSSSSVAEIDVTPPLPPILLSPADADHVNTNGLSLDWTDVLDPSSPVTYNYKSSWPGGSYGPVSTGTNSYINAPGTPDQTYLWQVQACDSAQNCSDWMSRTLTVDSTAPTADLIFPTPGLSSNYFEVAYSEPVNPEEAINATNYFLTNWPGAGGSGNLEGDANITYNEGTRTARILFTSPGWYISPEQLWGVQNIHDLAGNLLSISPYTEYSTQMTAPVLSSSPTTTPNPINQISQTWSWLAATDVGSGIKGYSTRTYDVVAQQYLSDWLWLGQVLGTTTNLPEGSWQLSLKATDNAGNESAILSSNSLVVDTTLPSIPGNLHFDDPSISCGGFTKDKLITIDWDDSSDNTQVAGYEYNIDYPLGNSRGSWTTFFTSSAYRGSLNEGTHYIKIRAKDTAGNYSGWSNSCSITYDSVAPLLKEQTSFTGWYTGAQTSYFDFVDANMADGYLAPSCEISSQGNSETCTITPNVCDKAGNCSTAMLTSNTAKIDFTKPLINYNAWGSTIDGNTSDSISGVDRVELVITKPDSSSTTVSAAGSTSWTYTMSDAPYGTYKVYATAYDLAGNKSEEAYKEFVMSPAAQSPKIESNSGSVQGAATTTEDVSPSKTYAPVKNILDDTSDTTSPKQVDIPPITTEHPEVLGETTAATNQYYWWWLIPIIIVFGYGVSKFLKSKARRG